MDVSEFAGSSFDPKSWIDRATRPAEKDEEREKLIVSLMGKLQVYFHQLNSDFEKTAASVVQHLPRVNRDAEKLSEDAANLEEKMRAVKEEIERIKRSTGVTIASLDRIDKVKTQLVRYKNALHEADKWTVLSNSIKASLDARDVDGVSGKVTTMQQSLNILTNAPDYEDKKLELDSFKNQLEAMASPLLLQAFTSKSVETSKKYVQVFRDMDRLPQLLKLYSQNQKSLLMEAWDVTSDTEENVVESLSNYYSLLISTWQEQIKWCDSVFSQTTGVDVLIDLFRDLCLALSPKFVRHMESSLKQVSEPLLLLSDFKACTRTFVVNLKSVIGSSEVNATKLSDLAKAIYSPYKGHISKYGVYQEAALHPHLASLTVAADDLMESVQNLASQNSRAFAHLDEASKMCATLTESCAYPGYLKCCEVFLNAYLNRYRLIRREIGETPAARRDDDVNMFQICLAILQQLGNFVHRLRQLDQECGSAVAKAQAEYSKPGIHPFVDYPKLLLDDTRRSEFEKLAAHPTETNQLSEFNSVFGNVRDLCQDMYDTTYKVMFDPILAILNVVAGSPSMWDTKKSPQLPSSSDLPDYSFVPQEYITQIGQYLMNLPQLLEPYLLSKNADLSLALSQVSSDFSALLDNSTDENCFAELFLEQIAKGTCKAYAKQILAIPKLSPFSSKQLATDINYLGNILEDMGFSLTKKLQEIVVLLKLSPSQFNSQSGGCSPRLVAEIRQIRNIPP